MTEQHAWRPQRYMFAWGIIALMAIVAIFATIGLVLYYIPRPIAPAGTAFPYYGFFGFRLFFGVFLVFAFFWFVRWAFWGWRWHYRGGYWGGYGYWRHRDGSYYILRERYARGEISKEEYDLMMRDLEQYGKPA